MGSCKVSMVVVGVFVFAISVSSGFYLPLKMARQIERPSTSLFLENRDTINEYIRGHPDHDRMNCQFSTIKGRRNYQEDRVFCNLGMRIPFPGNHTVDVDVVAVFDGHIGEEASEMASKSFFLYFILNTSTRILYPTRRVDGNVLPCDEANQTTLCSSMAMDELNHMEVLKEELLKTIKNLDDAFTHVAERHNFYAGTTAVVALIADEQILVANVGDSKALLCSKNAQSSHADGSPRLSPKELTRDHTALIDEERARIEAAGGFIIDSEIVPLIMGHFPMTRAIGDVPLKRYGIISEPEITEWLPLSADDAWLVVASDGIFESLTPKDVCNILDGSGVSDVVKPFVNKQQPLSAADTITRIAYDRGSRDNLSVVVVRLLRLLPSNAWNIVHHSCTICIDDGLAKLVYPFIDKNTIKKVKHTHGKISVGHLFQVIDHRRLRS